MIALSQLSINADRLNHHLEHLAQIGQQASGSICRLAFTPEDLQAREVVQHWMMEAGMSVRIDVAGNMIGRYAGQWKDAPALATGSHIDTVPSGGKYDGALGVLAGIEVVRSLHQNHFYLKHPLEVIVFTDEESTMIGSQAIAGTVLYNQPERYQISSGPSIQACLKAVNGDWNQLKTAQRDRTNLAAFVELHVEQGMVLEQLHKQIGIVQGVVGMERQQITILGRANHAGTTPMPMRQDALVAAAEIVLAVRRIAEQMPDDPVATVGSLTVEPNAVNIIPGKVQLSVDLRDLAEVTIDTMLEQLHIQLQAIARATDTQITTQPLLSVKPTLASPLVQSAIACTCEQLELTSYSLPSRAGHDALEVGRITDMGMIFVPSQAGLSHTAGEYTSPEQCAQGATVLLQTLLKLDDQY